MVPGHSSATQCWSRALSNIAPLRRKPFRSLPQVLDDVARQYGDKPALVMADEALTYRGLSRRKNQYASWAKSQSLAPGNVVCLLMRNRPEYVAVWLGLTQAGVVVALINTNLKGPALAHVIQQAEAACVIADAEFMPSLATVIATLPAGLTYWSYGGADLPGARRLDPAAFSTDPQGGDEESVPGAEQTALLIYTSGTTGLPKAARISHYRILEWSLWFAGMANVQPLDRLYGCLPLYHSTGGVALIGAMLVSGATVELRRRFSASTFWQDVASSGCTIFIYIGDLCRYLLLAPAHEAETRHALRLCVGNGLHGDVWRPFVARFQIPEILEFYASTEGNVSLYNCEGKPGAIGRVPGFLAKSFPVAIIECDADTGEPRRGEDGRCIRCPPGKQGEAIGLIANGAAAPSSFEGYTDAVATSRKILRNAFNDGDQWFRTGDLMMQDNERFFYFVDRMGDTFRWKGENVSSTEVAAALCQSPAVSFALVYGVRLAGADGRAGMAAITVTPSFCPKQLHAELAARLPHYARPMFLRICGPLEMTGTFKPIKVKLAGEGIGINALADPIYIDDAQARTYRRLDSKEAALLSGAALPTASASQTRPVG
jgi:fatty-acyl-CoA synthase